jgi:starch phosphorylase
VLYPNDQELRGKELRLEQQYFFVSCSLQDMFRILRTQSYPVEKFHEKFAVQLNDTHPAIAIAELMRLLVDEYAAAVGRRLGGHLQDLRVHQSHAAARGAGALVARGVRPRCCRGTCRSSTRSMRIFSRRCASAFSATRRASRAVHHRRERRTLRAHGAPGLRRQPRDQRRRRTALRTAEKRRAQGLLRIVAAEIQQQDQRRDAAALDGAVQSPSSRTSSPSTSATDWIKDLAQLKRLEPLAEDAEFRKRWREIKQHNKRTFAALALKRTGIVVDPDSMFDVLVKRIHEYKRQHLKVLHIVSLYHAIKSNPSLEVQPRTFIFGGKAAPGYHLAKLMIKLITAVGDVVNRDPDVRDRLKVVFLPNFNVTNGQRSTRRRICRSRSPPRARRPPAPAT